MDGLSKLEIKDENSLIKTVKAISLLDSWRWEAQDNYNFVNFFRTDLTNCEKILTHWICYITDRQMPFEIVWDIGGQVFSEMIYDYSRKNVSLKQLFDEHYEEYEDKEGKKRFRFKSTSIKNKEGKPLTFASRYVTDDYQNILQTLDILDNQKYKRNIVAYVVDIIRRFKDSDDLLLRVACELHLLTYQLPNKKANSEDIKKILTNETEFNKKLSEFKRSSTVNKKRLWCCIRDYKKGLYNEIFVNGIREFATNDVSSLIDVWNNLPMDQIELPGDVWNNSPLFKDNLIANLIDINKLPKSWAMPEIIRAIYERMRGEGNNLEAFYPEQFDITFDFVPRMCNKKLCDVCLFGQKGVDSICIPTNDKKCCPVALVSCGYVTICRNKADCDAIRQCSGVCKGYVHEENVIGVSK